MITLFAVSEREHRERNGLRAQRDCENSPREQHFFGANNRFLSIFRHYSTHFTGNRKNEPFRLKEFVWYFRLVAAYSIVFCQIDQCFDASSLFLAIYASTKTSVGNFICYFRDHLGTGNLPDSWHCFN